MFEMTVPKIIEMARAQLAEATGLKLSTTVSALKDDQTWRITVEMVEKKSIPDGMDILGIYEARLNGNGELLEFVRINMRKRMETVSADDVL